MTLLDPAALIETRPLIALAAVLVAILGVGRLSRVVTYDKFPPAAWVRNQWARITKDGDWALLARCQWCFTPWLMLICLVWAVFSDLHPSWWWFWTPLALAYVASIVIGRDEQRE